MLEDKIKKLFNKKEIEQIIQDNLISHELNVYPNRNELEDANIRNSLIDNIITTYVQFSKLDKIIDNQKEEFNLYMRDTISDMLLSRIIVDYPNYSEEEVTFLNNYVDNLKTLPQPEQRTDAWYKFRNDRLTASDLGVVLNMSPYSTYDKLVLKKCGHEEPFRAGPAIIHGQKYEDVAIAIYELRNDVNVFEFGCLPHPEVNHFGASPDGICDKDSNNKNFVGRMLEIKCPTSRPITGFPPDYYFAQVQGQLEVCNLEYCDFLECKIKEYNSSDEYFNDNGEELFYRENGMEKGVLVELWNNEQKKSKYIYGDMGMSKDEIDTWEDQIINDSLNDSNLDYVTTSYWKLEEYNCDLIKRDQEWFAESLIKINAFWNDVLKYRHKGVEELLERSKPKKRIKLNHYKEPKPMKFLSDTD